MKTVTMSAHLEGGEIKLDEPHEIPADARLLVTVLPPAEHDSEKQAWAGTARTARDRWSKENPY